MLQWLYTYVASIHFKCFSCFRSMLQVFYLNVAYVAVAIHIYCKRMFSNVSSVSDIYCSKCFMLQVVSLAGTGSERRWRWSLRAQQHGVRRRTTVAGACERTHQAHAGTCNRRGQAATACTATRACIGAQ
jgi:hypothetical protein